MKASKTKKTNKRAVNPTYSRPAFNTMATHHIGVIVTQYGDGANNNSHTPIGINIHGVTLEDANYYHADQYGVKRYNRWWAEVRRALEAGQASGVADGFMWKFVPEADPDHSPQYPLFDAPPLGVVKTGLREYAEAQGNPFQADGIYGSLEPVAEEIRLSLEGDGSYEKPAVNFVALVERLVGYIMAQDWYRAYERKSAIEHPRDEVTLLARDMATQLATDAITTTRPKFATE